MFDLIKSIFNRPMYEVDFSPQTGNYLLYRQSFSGWWFMEAYGTLEQAKKAIEAHKNNPVHEE